MKTNTMLQIKTMTSGRLFKFLLLAGLVFVNCAKATQIYDNLGGASGGVDPVGSFGPLYDSFTSPGTSQMITGVELALVGPGGTGTLTVGLYGDSSTTPGSLITTLGTISDPTIIAGENIYALSLISNPTLSPNTRYWIGLSDSGAGKWSWSFSTSGPGVAGEYFANSGGVWPNADGPYKMAVTGSPTPDAGSTASLLAVVVAGLAVLRRKLA